MQNPLSPRHRQEAEKFLVDFRQSSKPQNICKHLLVNSSDAAAQHQAIATLKDATLREWKVLDVNAITQLRMDLTNYVVTNANNLAPFVRKEGLHTVATIFKRGFFAGVQEGKQPGQSTSEDMIAMLNQMLQKDELELKSLALQLGYFLLQEFSLATAEANSFKMGLPLGFHVRAHRAFELHALPGLFTLVAQSLQFVLTTEELQRQAGFASFLRTCTQTLEKILDWTFAVCGVLCVSVSSLPLRPCPLCGSCAVCLCAQCVCMTLRRRFAIRRAPRMRFCWTAGRPPRVQGMRMAVTKDDRLTDSQTDTHRLTDS